MPFRIVTLKEWEALGLPTEISNIHLGNPDLVKKMKEHSEKNKIKMKIKSENYYSLHLAGYTCYLNS